jgi:GNAT superfamily N-acetyltransferase
MTAPRSSKNAELRIVSFTPAMADDLGKLFASDPSANACWCMWFITSVKDWQAAGADGNRAKFEALAVRSKEPLGLLAYQRGEPIAWCAVGPKERFARAVRTPTLKGHPTIEGETTWFVPCFFVRSDLRRNGITRALLERATSLAAQHGARLVEGFPFSGTRPRSSGDRQVGTEGVFEAVGFTAMHRPSDHRVVMRRSANKR